MKSSSLEGLWTGGGMLVWRLEGGRRSEAGSLERGAGFIWYE